MLCSALLGCKAKSTNSRMAGPQIPHSCIPVHPIPRHPSISPQIKKSWEKRKERKAKVRISGRVCVVLDSTHSSYVIVPLLQCGCMYLSVLEYVWREGREVGRAGEALDTSTRLKCGIFILIFAFYFRFFDAVRVRGKGERCRSCWLACC